MPIEKQARNGPALNKLAKTLNCRKRQPTSSGTEKIVCEGRRRMFLGKKLRTSSPAKCHITPYNWLEQLTNVCEQRKVRNMVENLTSLEGPSCYIRNNQFRNQNVDPLHTRATRGIQEQEIQNRFLFFAADPRVGLGERAPPSRVRGVRKSHQRKKSSCYAASIKTKVAKQFASRIVKPLDKKPNKKYKAYTHFSESP